MIHELLRCPFCGGDAYAAQVRERSWLAECRKLACGVTLYGRLKKEVVAKWNTRDQSLSERIAVLEGALKPFANCADTYADAQPDSRQVIEREPGILVVNLGDLRNARASLIKEVGDATG